MESEQLARTNYLQLCRSFVSSVGRTNSIHLSSTSVGTFRSQKGPTNAMINSVLDFFGLRCHNEG